MNEWISVKDRLPDPHVPYLVACSNEQMYVARWAKGYTNSWGDVILAAWTPSCECFYAEDQGEIDVIFYQPLPEPPKGG